MDALTCPGMSSGPSYVCTKNSSFQDSGTVSLSARSSLLPGPEDVESHTASDALVCCMKTLSHPVRTFDPTPMAFAAAAISAVTSWHPLPGAVSVTVVCPAVLATPAPSIRVVATSLACPTPIPPTFLCSHR